MARQRGGIAGFYDRNKGWLKTAVPAALSFIPGAGIPLAAAAGAAMGGDVEGKGYFKGLGSTQGLTGAALGGLQGYGVGRGTQSLAGGLRGMFAPTSTATPSLPPVDMTSKIGITPEAPSALNALRPVDMASKIGMTPGVSESMNAAPSATRAMFTASPPPPVASPVLTPTSPTPWWKTKEGLSGLAQSAGALANIYGTQQSTSLQREEMDRQRREAEARAQLMALFAPGILSTYQQMGAFGAGGR